MSDLTPDSGPTPASDTNPAPTPSSPTPPVDIQAIVDAFIVVNRSESELPYETG